MMSTFTRKRGTLGAVVAGAFAATLLLGSLTPASAAPAAHLAPNQILTPADAAAAGRTPQLDWLGSQVAKHEPHGNPDSGARDHDADGHPDPGP